MKRKNRWQRTTEEFINLAKQVHGDKYDYNKTIYVNCDEKVLIQCKIHGDFYQTPTSHLSGFGCIKCGHENKQKHVHDTQSFIQKSKELFGNIYNYNKTIYISAKKSVIITCPIHGDFIINAHNHISKRYGCRKCSREQQINKKKSNKDEFVKKSIFIHGLKYDYSKFEYIDAHSKSIIICHKHGEFLQDPNHHLNGRGCPKCRRSHGEIFVAKILDWFNINYKSEVVVKTDLKKFRIDFVIEKDNKTYYIEYNGVQHYIYTNLGANGRFELQKQRDAALREYTKNNNIKLLEIRYSWSEKRIVKEIIQFLNLIVPINSDIYSKLGELLETPITDNRQLSIGLTSNESSETNTWNCYAEHNSDTSAQQLNELMT